MNKYLFMIAWIEDSDSAFDNGNEYKKIRSPEDLFPQFEADNTAVFSVLVTAPNEMVAIAFGTHKALHSNYTGYDSVSDCVKLEPGYVMPHLPTKEIVVDLTSE